MLADCIIPVPKLVATDATLEQLLQYAICNIRLTEQNNKNSKVNS